MIPVPVPSRKQSRRVRRAHYRQTLRSIRGHQRIISGKVSELFENERRNVMNTVETLELRRGSNVTRSQEEKIIGTVEDDSQDWVNVLGRQLERVFVSATEQLIAQVQSETAYPGESKQDVTIENLFREMARRAAFTRAGSQIPEIKNATKAQLRGVIGELRRDIRNALSEGLDIGHPRRVLRERLNEKYESMGRVRNRRIARTESVAMYGRGLLDTAKEQRVVREKEWLANPDFRVRPSHNAADGQRVKLRKSFTLTGPRGTAELEHPGDFSAPAWAVVNCRCTMLMHTRQPL